ncbi:Uncharacterized membrane protein, DUF485 family [Amycolatopsis xylanica]|uniref:Uncharacterized membrane protein, DUF485 family n=1 Tax=Amycolatopsis xylanica TaxID=589385 RepID=A0A1H3IJ86_9PSEU|nr:DUF485 domain-containing protein [Amycolatopsis xylanica]SDY27770.1 Uncharacterized membrane protein, DUF485 family [Amycolatopsis xylanica]
MQDIAHSPALIPSARRRPVTPPRQLPPMFVRGNLAPEPEVAGQSFDEIRDSPEFVSLRSRLRRFVFPMSLAFFTWYLTYVLLAAYAHEFMSLKVIGEVNLAIVLGLGQFASTAVITAVYVRFANRRIDPQVDEVRARAEGAQ